jgi:hypothetical protein
VILLILRLTCVNLGDDKAEHHQQKEESSHGSCRLRPSTDRTRDFSEAEQTEASSVQNEAVFIGIA